MNSRRLLLVWLYLSLAAVLQSNGADLPQLNVTNQATNLVISWPDAAHWVLEETSNLQSIVPWTLVSPDLYQSNAASRFISFPTNAGSRFFRLRQIGLSVPGLKGYWGLDEGSGQASQDGSEFGSALLFTNATWGAGRIGPGALRFTGSSAGPTSSRAWISNDNYRVLPPSGNPFSLSLWLNPDALPLGWSAIAGNNATGLSGWQVLLNNEGPGTNFFVFTSAGVPNSLSITGRFLLLPGQWHQLTVTHNGSAGSIYLDSALLASGNGPLATHDGPILFGGGVAGNNSFLGRIDDLRLYTNCLSFEQISLTGSWLFDEAAGQVCDDSSIQGHSALLTNVLARVSGHNGTGIDLSKSSLRIGNEDYAVLPPNGGSFSISFWLRPSSLESGWSGLMKLGEGPIGGWDLTLLTDDSGKTSLRLCSTNAGGTLDLLAPVPFIAATWTKLDITFNGGIATLYANGKQLRAENGAIRGTKSPLLVGAVPTLPSFNGVIDDLKIYSRERGASEIGPVANTMWETVMLNSSTNIVLQGDGPPGKTLTYSLVPILTPTNGSVSVSGNTFTYTAGSSKGPDAFTYTVTDGEFTSDPAIVTMSVVQPHYLSPTGGYLSPQDGTSPLQAWLAGPPDAMDAILKTNNYYDCFFYAPGEYQTRGWKYLERQTANTGCKHIGAGSEGLQQTVLKLVDIWAPWTEETIFGIDGYFRCDGFEVHSLVLDCNAANVPKYAFGEPVNITIPLFSTGRVEAITLHWDHTSIYGNTPLQISRPVDFGIKARRLGTNTYSTNVQITAVNDLLDTFALEGVEADELILQLNQRGDGVDFYGLKEVEVVGTSVSLPLANTLDGNQSRLDADSTILSATDGDAATSWASGPETQVQIVLPFNSGTTISQVALEWNCKNIVGIGRLGPAAHYKISARDEARGLFYDVPFLSAGRTPAGVEICTFGTSQSNAVVQTDQLVITLTEKEGGIDFYSLKEITPRNGPYAMPLRMPTATSTINWGPSMHILKAFDHDDLSHWAGGFQGMVGAVAARGNNLKFRNLRVLGFGTKAFRECFAIYLGPATSSEPRHMGNIVVEDCVFNQPASANRDGVTALNVAAGLPDTLTNAIIRRCTFEGMKPYFSYSQAMATIHSENCVVRDCSAAVYYEPDPSIISQGPVIIRSNQFFNVDNGVLLRMHPGAQFESVICIANEMVLTGFAGWGLAACDTCFGGESGAITNLVALRNIVRYDDWSEQPNSIDGGFGYTDIHHAVFGNNVIGLGTANNLRVRPYPAGMVTHPGFLEDCDHPGPFPSTTSYVPDIDALRPGYKRAWFNNHDVSGRLLNVRFNYFGVDRLASEQQWPE